MELGRQENCSELLSGSEHREMGRYAVELLCANRPLYHAGHKSTCGPKLHRSAGLCFPALFHYLRLSVGYAAGLKLGPCCEIVLTP